MRSPYFTPYLMNPLAAFLRHSLPLFVCLLVGVFPVSASLELPTIFTDGMVLQQKKPVIIWGKASSGAKLEVSLAGHSASATADKEGNFQVQLPALDAKAQTKPLELVVKGPEKTVAIKDVLVGEVWVCSGQSNMQWSLSKSENSKQAIEQSTNPNIHLFRVPLVTSVKPLSQMDGAKWVPCDPETAKAFSAVGYYFGKDLQAELGVPVGLIQSAWGGTPIQAWTPVSDMSATPETEHLIKMNSELLTKEKEFEAERDKQVKEWEAEKAKAKKEGTQFKKRKPRGHYFLRKQNRVGTLYNGMIAPLTPYPLAGAIWYQGESDSGRGKLYQTQLPLMIAAWRRDFHNPDMPFGIVQLANFQKRQPEPSDSKWAELREAQLKTYRDIPNTGLAVIIDIGQADDIHPGNKKDVGGRLAAWALADVYGKDVTSSGPIYKSMAIDGDSIRLTFDHMGGGLEAKGAKLEGFSIAGADKKFVWADAKIDGETIVVSSPKVKAPVAVRYAWADNPAATLYNKAGLPASPFRTDSE